VILRVSMPTQLVLEQEVSYVQAEDATGRFGILPGHERFLTVLVPSILLYRTGRRGGGRESYVAVRQGVLRVTEEGVSVAAREAVASENLGELQESLRRLREKRTLRDYQAARSLYQMQIGAWRRLMEYEDVRSR